MSIWLSRCWSIKSRRGTDQIPQSHSQLQQQTRWIPSSPPPSSSTPPPTRRLAEAAVTPIVSFRTPSPSPPTRRPVAAAETPTASSLEFNSRFAPYTPTVLHRYCHHRNDRIIEALAGRDELPFIILIIYYYTIRLSGRRERHLYYSIRPS
ncbi:hypothetical protein BDZ97DRAFT_781596 [Flammula alnicola]|nr:hypothetical protein BDZ97DRAFT_781596 [Flammula alnicola]